jgi:hypothetical protein
MKKEEKRNEITKHYAKLRSHCFISGAYFFFDLWITRSISLLEVALQLLAEGSSFLNNQLFLSVQMLQHMMMISSIANGAFNCLLIFLTARCGLSRAGTCTPIRSQQFLAKGHLRNRCLNFSSFCSRPNSHI